MATIDQINIYWASKRAMENAVGKLTLRPEHLLIDAMRINFDCAQTPIIHGDALSASSSRLPRHPSSPKSSATR